MEILKHANPAVQSLRPYEPGRPIEEVAREFNLDPGKICKLASNENPLGCSPKVSARLAQVLADVRRYPDGGAYYLRRKLAGRLGVAPEELIFGNGSNEVIEFVGHCFMGPGVSVVASAHAFVVYKLVAHMFGARFIEVPTRGLGHDLEAMARAIEPDTRVVFICNPNNPTGTFLSGSAIKKFMEQAPDDVLVVFDEAYHEVCLSRMPKTLDYVRAGRACLVLRTFSKAYGLAGLRLGYGIGPAPLIATLEKARQPFNTNRLAQEAAMAALDDEGFIRAGRRLVREARAYIEDACRRAGLEFEPTHANFILIRVGDGVRVARELTRRGVIVRPMAGYGLPEYIRVTFGLPHENERFMQELLDILRA